MGRIHLEEYLTPGRTVCGAETKTYPVVTREYWDSHPAEQCARCRNRLWFDDMLRRQTIGKNYQYRLF